MTARPSIALLQLSATRNASHAERLGPFQEACLKLAEQLKDNQPQTKNGIEVRLEKSTSVLLGNKWFLCFRETEINHTKVLEVVWGADEVTPRPTITLRAHWLDGFGLVQRFLAPTSQKPSPQL